MRTIEQPAVASGFDAEALIKEARRRQRKRHWLIAATITAVVAVVVTIAGIGGGIPTRGSRSRDRPAPVHAARQALRVRWRVKVAAGVAAVTLADGSLWVAGSGEVTRLDPLSGRVIARIRTRTLQVPDVIGFDGRIWVSSGGFGDNVGALYEINPQTDKVARAFRVPGQPAQMTGGGAYIWVDMQENEGQVLRPFNPRTGRFLAPVAAAFEDLNAPSYGLESVWASSAVPTGIIWRIDARTMRSSQFWPGQSSGGQPPAILSQPGMVATSDGWVWAVFDDALARFDPATGTLKHTLRLTNTEGMFLQASGSALWVLMRTGSSSGYIYVPDPGQPGRVARIDPRTGTLDGAPIAIGSSAGYDSFAASPTMAWVGDRENSTVTAVSSDPVTDCSGDCGGR